MPFATNPGDGVRINYVVEGDHGPVVVQYGFMGYIDAWYEAGYVEALARDVRLVLFDPRGMEQSDCPHDPDQYGNSRMATDVTAILDAVGAETGHFWGYSRGGRVGFELALRHVDRIRSVVVGAMHPYRRDPAQFDEQIELFSMGWERSIPHHEAENGPLDPAAREQLLRNDSQALAASCIANRRDPGFGGELSSVEIPVLMYCGDRDAEFHDRARQAAGEIPSARFVSLPGIDHGQLFWRSGLVAPLVRDFVLGCTALD